jgi:hypothetical protein
MRRGGVVHHREIHKSCGDAKVGPRDGRSAGFAAMDLGFCVEAIRGSYTTFTSILQDYDHCESGGFFFSRACTDVHRKNRLRP